MDITRAVKGQPLTPYEKKVYGFLIDGHNEESISNQMGIKRNTVKQHKTSIFRKLGTTSTHELVVNHWKAVVRQIQQEKIEK